MRGDEEKKNEITKKQSINCFCSRWPRIISRQKVQIFHISAQRRQRVESEKKLESIYAIPDKGQLEFFLNKIFTRFLGAELFSYFTLLRTEAT